ncbi:MAG: hypothetical protein UW29_C0014G0017, partial [Candidatus Collierbacteria bacterium GW2011_GWC2_44_13]
PQNNEEIFKLKNFCSDIPAKPTFPNPDLD